MRLADLEYNLPQELIAQAPARPRDASRMLVLRRDGGQIEHRKFGDILAYLTAQDVLVMNNTRVIPARLFGHKEADTPEKQVEVLLLRCREGTVWEALVKPGKKLRRGARVVFAEGIAGEVEASTATGSRLIRFAAAEGGLASEEVNKLLLHLGRPPLPPYITAPLQHCGDYQTIYAKKPGSSAAPTAGLHFTRRILHQIAELGAAVSFITLHIGPATFRPIASDEVDRHPMPPEEFWLPADVVETINRARAQGGRVIAVGTSTCRVLESCINDSGQLASRHGETSLFIREGYKFRATDALLTNFHLPRSTNLLLAMAYAGREHLLAAYKEAIEERYSFFSFGDAMLIV